MKSQGPPLNTLPPPPKSSTTLQRVPPAMKQVFMGLWKTFHAQIIEVILLMSSHQTLT